jgi:hypothetical protein
MNLLSQGKRIFWKFDQPSSPARAGLHFLLDGFIIVYKIDFVKPFAISLF